MNYLKVYDDFIVDRLSKQKIDGYREKHHIIPKSLGGTNDKSNIIVLTAEDHIRAHVLLAKIYGNQMWAALKFMLNTREQKIPSKLLRKHLALSKKKQADVASVFMKENAPWKGKEIPEYAKKKMSESAKNRPPISEATRNKLRKNSLGRKMPKDGVARSTKAKEVKVINLETGIVYDSGTKAAKILGLLQDKISAVVRGTRKSTGGLRFAKFDGSYNIKHYENLRDYSRVHDGKPKKVINITTCEIFESSAEAQRVYKNQSINNVLRGLNKTASGCKWMWLSEYEREAV